MNATDMLERDPATIEAGIHMRRHALDRKLQELERRLSPSHRWNAMRARFDGAPVASWSAVVAVAAGTWMAISGFRRYRFVAPAVGMDNPMLTDMMGE